MGRSPFCEKTGLRKGPWIPEEDQMLVAYVQRHGHGNWRALPKQAGLLRCGKSCRLRWINYLRPDIKRGNFSKEEEETIIKLHETLGNRWSTIAARLPGRTDNEIKNVWHTHLKKRLKQKQATPVTKRLSTETPKCDASTLRESEPMNFPTHLRFESPACALVSPQQSSSDFSSITESSAITSENHNRGIKEEYISSSGTFPEIDESFWSEALSTENSGMPEDNPAIKTYPQLELPFSPVSKTEPICSYGLNTDDGMAFWYNVFIKAGELPEWPEF